MPRNRQAQTKLPNLRAFPALPRGPRLYKEPKFHGYVGSWMTPPPGFVNGNNSMYEWMIYKAIAYVLGYPEHPEHPPFIGFPGLWSYQKAFDQGRHMPGGSVIDFMIYGGGRNNGGDMGIRVQTEFFHIFTDSVKHTYDELQRWRLAQFMTVIDLFDQDFAFDPTGQAAVKLIKRALAGEYSPDPLSTGTAQRVRPGNLIG